MNPLAVYNSMFYDDRVSQTTMFMDSGAGEHRPDHRRRPKASGFAPSPSAAITLPKRLPRASSSILPRPKSSSANGRHQQIRQADFPGHAPGFLPIWLPRRSAPSASLRLRATAMARIGRIVAPRQHLPSSPACKNTSNKTSSCPSRSSMASKPIPPPTPNSPHPSRKESSPLPAPYGLALQAMGQSKISSSLLPQTIRRPENLAGKRPSGFAHRRRTLRGRRDGRRRKLVSERFRLRAGAARPR